MLTRNRIIGALLLISWTLNVALGVALIYSKKSPHFGRPPFGERFGPPGEGIAPTPPGIPREFRETMRREIEPLMEEQHCMAEELYATLVSDTLDTTRLGILADSLGELRCQIQKTMISQMAGLHGKLSHEQRARICSRMIGRIDGEEHDRRFRHRDPR